MGSYRNMTFLVIVIANILIGTIQEYRAQKTIRELQLLNVPKLHVLRDGKEYVERFAEENGRVPTDREYRSWLLSRPAFVRARIGVFFEDILSMFRSLAEQIAAAFRR